MSTTVAAAWAAAVREAGTRPILVFDDVSITYAELDYASDMVAAGLLAAGRKRGDRVALIGMNRPEWLVVYLAAAKLGIIIVAISVRYREGELLHMLGQSGAVMLITPRAAGDFRYEGYLEKLQEKLPDLKSIVYLDGDASPLHGTVDRDTLDALAAQIEPSDPLVLIYTSGTTGVPKGATLTNASQLASANAQREHTRGNEDDVGTLALPLNHVGGITCAFLAAVTARASCILMPAFSPKFYVDQIKKHGATTVTGVPTMLTLVLREPGLADMDGSRIRMIITGGSNVEPQLYEALHARFPNATFMNLYGLSETSGAAVMSSWDGPPDIISKSIGKPLGGVSLQIRDDAGNEVPTGETGEIWIKGGPVVAGYWAMPEETAASFTDGWLHTGDLAYVDEKGNVVLRGRKKEMFLQGGYNVYPVEVENVLARHPAVLMVAGIGIPDEILGEVGCYYIVPKEGMTVTDEELIAFCKDKVADYKVPRRIIQRAELPLTPAGKIQKSSLKAESH